MLNAKGYAIISDPDAPLQEYDTTYCCHCHAIIFVKPGTVNRVYLISVAPGLWQEEDGAACYSCGLKPVCLPCHEKGTCTPFEKWLDEVEGTLRKGRIII